VRANLVAQGVVAVNRLEKFLQTPFGILLAEQGGEPFGQTAPYHASTTGAFAGGEIAVEVDGTDHRLERVLENRGPLASTGVLFALPQAQRGIELEVPGPADWRKPSLARVERAFAQRPSRSSG